MSIQIERGELDGARQMLAMFSRLEDSTDVQDLSCYLGSRAALQRAEGRLADALADAEQTIEVSPHARRRRRSRRNRASSKAIEAALALGDTAKAEELLLIVEGVPAGTRPPYLDAQAQRFRARMDGDASGFESAAATFRELGPAVLARRHTARARRAAPATRRRSTRRARSSSDCGRRRGSSGSMRLRLPAGAPRCTRDLPELRHREPRGAEVLRRVRRGARERLPGVRRRERAGREVLRRVRRDARLRGGTALPPRPPRPQPSAGSSPSSSPTSSASRRSRRAATPRRCASSSPATSTRAAASSSCYGGTVEKFIGDAVMAVWGTPDRDRGRRRARGARSARPGRRRVGARRRDRRTRACRSRRRADRRGRRHARRRGPGHGRRRPRQHRLAHPVRGRARHGARRRDDAARERAPRSSTRTRARTS